MPRYNTSIPASTTTGSTTFGAPTQGVLTTLSGSPPYTVTLASPVLYVGFAQSFYNSTAGNITLSTPSGSIKGPGFTTGATQVIPAGATYTLTSDGVNYVITNNEGGPQVATAFTTSAAFTANGSVAMSPANNNVVISPSGSGTVTVNPATKGTINNIDIGGTTAGTATFTTLTLNTTMNGSGTIDGGTF
jgi:hypothetical protein